MEKKIKKITILMLLLISLLLANSNAAQTSNSIESKIALENSLEKKLYNVLSEALGTTDLIVMISVQLQEEQKKNEIAEILPGIPQEERVGQKSLSETMSMIKKITATILVDQSISKEDEKVIRDLTSALLGISPDREDLINIEKMVFRKQNVFTLQSLLYPPNLWFTIFTLLLIVFMFFIVKTFFVPISSSLKNIATSMSTSATTEKAETEKMLPEEKAIAITEEKTLKSAETNSNKLFDFLENANINNLLFIMKQKTVEDLTILLNYAPPHISAQLIESLYPQSIEAVKLLPQVKLMLPEKVKKLETELKTALDFVIGGETKTKDLLESLDESIQDKVINYLSQISPDFSAKISPKIVKFSFLKELQPNHAQMLSRRTGMRSLALALKNADFVNDFMQKFSEGMRERFKEELDLIRVLPEHIEKAERKKVISALKQLMEEGYVQISKSEAKSQTTVVNAEEVK